VFKFQEPMDLTLQTSSTDGKNYEGCATK